VTHLTAARPPGHRRPAALVLAATLALGACTAPQPGAEFNDPYEPLNRQVHAINKGLDTVALRPAGQIATAAGPETLRWAINFSDNASLPGMALNKALQGDIEGMAVNSMRFIVNTTLGFAGLNDIASDLGLEEQSTDFGQTLAVWGVPEGAYLELPLLGPSTERDAVGEVVDILLNPLEHWGTPVQLEYGTIARVGEIVIERGQFGGTIDSILYDSADSYAQARLLYLQNRRFELGEEPPRATPRTDEDEAYVDDLLEDLYQ